MLTQALSTVLTLLTVRKIILKKAKYISQQKLHEQDSEAIMYDIASASGINNLLQQKPVFKMVDSSREILPLRNRTLTNGVGLGMCVTKLSIQGC